MTQEINIFKMEASHNNVHYLILLAAILKMLISEILRWHHPGLRRPRPVQTTAYGETLTKKGGGK